MTQLEHLAWSHTTLSLVAQIPMAQTPSLKLSEWCENRNDKLKPEELKEDSLGGALCQLQGGGPGTRDLGRLLIIKHPNFHKLNSQAGEAYLHHQEQGDVVIRPSSKGMNHLAVTWKVDKLYQHISKSRPYQIVNWLTDLVVFFLYSNSRHCWARHGSDWEKHQGTASCWWKIQVFWCM